MSERARRKQADAARERIRDYNDIRKRGGMPDLVDVRALVESEDPDIASRAAALLLITVAGLGHEAFEAETAQLIRVVRSGNLPQRADTYLLGGLTWTRCLYMLQAVVRTRRQPDPGLLAQTAELAELGYALDPNSYPVRKSLAFVRCLQDRSLAARDLLITAPIDGLRPTLRSDVLAVRALIELQLEDVAQARRFVELAQRFDATTGLIIQLERAVTALEQRSATDPGPDAAPSTST